jgi:hypothetical protein
MESSYVMLTSWVGMIQGFLKVKAFEDIFFENKRDLQHTPIVDGFNGTLGTELRADSKDSIEVSKGI